MKGSLEL